MSEVAHAADNWHEVGRALGMSDEELETFADAFEHSERAAAKKVISLTT